MTLTMWILAGLGLLGVLLCYITLGVISEGVSRIRALLERQDDRTGSLAEHVSEIRDQLDRATRLIEDLRLTPAERDRKKASRRFDQAQPLDRSVFSSLGAGGSLRLIEREWMDDGDEGVLDYSIFEFRYDRMQQYGARPETVTVYGARRLLGSSGWDDFSFELTGNDATSASGAGSVRLLG